MGKVRVISCYLVQVVEVLAWGTGTGIKYPVLMSTHSTSIRKHLHVMYVVASDYFCQIFLYFCLLDSSDVYAHKKMFTKAFKLALTQTLQTSTRTENINFCSSQPNVFVFNIKISSKFFCDGETWYYNILCFTSTFFTWVVGHEHIVHAKK